MARKIILTLLFSIMACLSRADMSLDSVDREILGAGLHRKLSTNVTYTTDNASDLQYCSFVFRENITSDLYIYYEEVTRDMPGFETWPHHLPMNIEEPAQISKPQDFIWRLPLTVNSDKHSFVTRFESSVEDLKQLPQTNKVTIEFPFHYRYQPVQTDSDFKPVSLIDPKVFIECFDRDLVNFRTGTEAPIIDQLTEKNRPKQDLTKLIPVGRLEH